MVSDAELLRRYAKFTDEGAFTELVGRNLKLVYSAALRQVGNDRHMAQDVAQTVFTALAHKAAVLSKHPLLTAWLYRSTQFSASNAVRSSQLRTVYEKKAAVMNTANSDDEAYLNWETVRPVIDTTLCELKGGDRDAILLRFFEGRSFSEVAAKLKVSEDAARMRVNRALENARATLKRRGITSSSAALAIVLAENAVAAEPAGLAAVISKTAVTSGAALGAGGSVALLVNSMSTTKITVGLTTAAALFFLGTTFYQFRRSSEETARLNVAIAQANRLEARLSLEESLVGKLKAENTRLSGAVTQAAAIQAASDASGGRITKSTVDARYKNALELAHNGDSAGALKELLWCYDVGFPQVSSYRFARNRALLTAIAKLGANYPDADDALLARSDAASKAILASPYDFESVADFIALNKALQADDLTLDFYDQLPQDDQRRASMARSMYEQFVGAQRYADALGAKPYSSMNAGFDALANLKVPPGSKVDPALVKADAHQQLVSTTTANIETLAGAGDLAHAQELINKLLAVDTSEATRALLQQHLQRAGHPELLTIPSHG
jgi:RNA polymerase sigma factor (sigma-70 family)